MKAGQNMSNARQAARKMLPGTINLKSTAGDFPIKVLELDPTGVPEKKCQHIELECEHSWGKHKASTVPAYLKTWTVPEKIQRAKDRIQSVVENGLPDARRRVLRGQETGNLDDRFLADLGAGSPVERPWWKWSRKSQGPKRVAICFDAQVLGSMMDTDLLSRCGVCLALGGALEASGYPVSILAASIEQGNHPDTNKLDYRDMRISANTVVEAIVLKPEHEPLVESGFAHFSSTDLRRLIASWVVDNGGASGSLSNSEWRQLTDADLFVYIGSKSSWAFASYLPSSETLGPSGDDTLRLEAADLRDIDLCCEKIEEFFQAQCQ